MAEYDVWHRNPLVLLEHQLANPDFDSSIDYVPKVVTDEQGEHEVCDLMSGQWAWDQCVRIKCLIQIETHFIQQEKIGKDPQSHGAMFAPIVLGSDKTTVSVGTGHTEYYPLYIYFTG